MEDNYETNANEGQLNSYAFIKCANQKNVSNEIARKQNTLVITDPVNNAKKQLDFTKIFSQFDLDSLDKEFQGLFSEIKQTYILLYGMPLNIKLFIFHKSVNCFISNLFSTIVPGNTSVHLDIVFASKMTDIITSIISKKGEHFISSTEYACEQMPEYSLFSKFVLKPNNKATVDKFKAVCFS